MDKIEEYFNRALLNKKGTQVVLRCHIKKYFKVNNLDIETYFNKKQPYEEHLRNYWQYLQDKAPKTRMVAIHSIKGFLAMMDKKTKTLDVWDTLKHRMKGTEATHEKHVPDIGELKQILHFCDIRTKASILVALTSGMRIGEVCGITDDDVYLEETPARISIPPEIAKNGKRRTTFISEEATGVLKEWLRVKDDYIKKSMERFNFKNLLPNIDLNKENDRRIFPYHTSRIRRSFNKACENAGFTGKTEMKGDFDFKLYGERCQRTRRKLNFHNLRSFFRSYLGNADLSEKLMGHTGLAGIYDKRNDKQLAQEYMKYVCNVTVFERPADLTDINEQLQEKDKEMHDLKMQLLELRVTVQELKNGKK